MRSAFSHNKIMERETQRPGPYLLVGFTQRVLGVVFLSSIILYVKTKYSLPTKAVLLISAKIISGYVFLYTSLKAESFILCLRDMVSEIWA